MQSLVGVCNENNTSEGEIFCDMQSNIMKPIQKMFWGKYPQCMMIKPIFKEIWGRF